MVWCIDCNKCTTERTSIILHATRHRSFHLFSLWSIVEWSRQQLSNQLHLRRNKKKTRIIKRYLSQNTNKIELHQKSHKMNICVWTCCTAQSINFGFRPFYHSSELETLVENVNNSRTHRYFCRESHAIRSIKFTINHNIWFHIICLPNLMHLPSTLLLSIISAIVSAFAVPCCWFFYFVFVDEKKIESIQFQRWSNLKFW